MKTQRTHLKSFVLIGALLGAAASTHGAPPVSFTQPAVLLTDTSAELHGLVNTNGALTTNWFEWGADSTGLEFDGAGDFVQAGAVNLANSSFTLEA